MKRSRVRWLLPHSSAVSFPSLSLSSDLKVYLAIRAALELVADADGAAVVETVTVVEGADSDFSPEASVEVEVE